MSIAFEGEAEFFDHIAERAGNPADGAELHRVADEYRALDRLAPLLPPEKLSRSAAFRFRAEECRTLAEQFSNPECRKYLAELAKTYDHLAESSETTEYLHSLDEDNLFQHD
jgi:hypothetical protein